MSNRSAQSRTVLTEPELAQRLRESVLPGDPRFTPAELDAAVRCIRMLAQDRQSAEPAIGLETVTETGRRFMRIVLINDDMPFLVDSTAATIAAHGLSIDRLVHPVIDHAGGRESVIYVETPRTDARTRRALLASLRTTMAEVHAAVRDWPQLRAAMKADAERLDDAEGAALLRWFEGGMLTQLGHVVRRRDGSLEQPRGICRTGECKLLSPVSYERAFQYFAEPRRSAVEGAPLIVKSNRISTVHRRAPIDLFIVPIIEQGETVALSVHAGIWTSAALASPPDRVPRLRRRLAALMDRLGFDPAGHAGKSLTHVLTTLPHDLLISFAPADLERVAAAAVSLVDRPRPNLVLVCAPLERHLFVFVWLPRDAVSTATRLQIVDMLHATAGSEILDWSLEVEASATALLRFSIDIRACADAPSEAALNRQLRALVRGWSDAVEAELRELGRGLRSAGLAARYAEAFPLAYRGVAGPAEAARDILRLRDLPAFDPARAARLYSKPGDAQDEVRLKLYQRTGMLALSDAVPVLENFGFRVVEEVPTALDAGQLGAIHDFRLAAPSAGAGVGMLLDRAEVIERAIAAVINQTAENDAFNRLIVTNALSPAQANGLRACYRYLRQTGLTYGILTAVQALERAPAVTQGIVDLFIARHDPRFEGDRQEAGARAGRAIDAGLAEVAAINDDRVLRQFRAVVEAILRTNAFLPDRETLAFKLDPSLVPDLPRPVPWREIFVYSRRVEGVHLRAGPVARGGIRWSDRRDDYRTEILGLMKAQRVKNAVIVPTGAKGGFFPRQLPDPALDREGWLAEGREGYRQFIRALLSLTDNIVEGEVIPPSGIVVRDGEDPYFVVAADKGTASFSDMANAIADERDFWLDDAFASGGSNGYDHKAMGITARGAWLSVQRHFRERGIDVQTDPVRVVGCGDMSGDVFGNGMLLSKSMRLIAAFDHRHVFIDPDPDPAKSWGERARLFAVPRSSWADYDPALISPGGGVWPRSQKQIPLSPQARKVLGIDAESADPDLLIRALLTAPVDLLWFGGIGTFVKASSESNIKVGDPANDAVRVDGAALRAAVVGEGANLGCTQAGRIEFAMRGGRINTDFIDNSAGVDCSDHEVNIKIALAAAKRAGRLTETERIALLEKMTEEVAALVLEDNRLQALALSVAEGRGARAVPAQVRLIETLEAAGLLDRKTEGLADNTVLLRRGTDGFGLTRPELAVLLSSAKLALQGAIEAGPLPDDPLFVDDLLAAFPTPMRKPFSAEILAHRLRREIVATKLANRLVNRLGIIVPFELAEEEGVGLAQVAGAFAAGERLFGMDAVWRSIETAEMPEGVRLMLFHRAAEALRNHMAGLIRVSAGALTPGALLAQLSPGVTTLRATAESLLSGEALVESARLREELVAAGAPQAEAERVVHLFDLSGAVGLAYLAQETGSDPARLTRAFALLGDRLGLGWAQAAASRLSPSDPWERLMVAGLARDFQQMRFDFLRRHVTPDAEPAAAVNAWLQAHEGELHAYRGTLARAQAAPAVSPAMLAQIAGQARTALAR